MMLKINPSSGVPIGQQIVDGIKYLVACRRLRAGEAIPSVRELAREAQVNPTTVMRAYTQLEHEGLISMRQGQGTFISMVPPDLTPRQKERRLEPLALQLAVEALRLGISSERMHAVLDQTIQGMLKEGD
jgi:GntR family transcriptional regulator